MPDRDLIYNVILVPIDVFAAASRAMELLTILNNCLYGSTFSALLDGTTWDPLQYPSKESMPDNIAAIFNDGNEEVWIFGDEGSTEVWPNNGQVQPMFPFHRNPSAIISRIVISGKLSGGTTPAKIGDSQDPDTNQAVRGRFRNRSQVNGISYLRDAYLARDLAGHSCPGNRLRNPGVFRIDLLPFK